MKQKKILMLLGVIVVTTGSVVGCGNVVKEKEETKKQRVYYQEALKEGIDDKVYVLDENNKPQELGGEAWLYSVFNEETKEHVLIRSKSDDNNKEEVIAKDSEGKIRIIAEIDRRIGYATYPNIVDGYLNYSSEDKNFFLDIKTGKCVSVDREDGFVIEIQRVGEKDIFISKTFAFDESKKKIVKINRESGNEAEIVKDILNYSVYEDEIIVIDKKGIISYVNTNNGEVKQDKEILNLKDVGGLNTLVVKDKKILYAIEVDGYNKIYTKEKNKESKLLNENVSLITVEKDLVSYKTGNGEDSVLNYVDLNDKELKSIEVAKMIEIGGGSTVIKLEKTGEIYMTGGDGLYKLGDDKKIKQVIAREGEYCYDEDNILYFAKEDGSNGYKLFLNDKEVQDKIEWISIKEDATLYRTFDEKTFEYFGGEIIELPKEVNKAESMLYGKENDMKRDSYLNYFNEYDVRGYWKQVEDDINSDTYVNFNEFGRSKVMVFRSDIPKLENNALEYRKIDEKNLEYYRKNEETVRETLLKSGENEIILQPSSVALKFVRITEDEYNEAMKKAIEQGLYTSLGSQYFGTLEPAYFEKKITIEGKEYYQMKNKNSEERVLINDIGKCYNYDTYMKEKKLEEEQGKIYENYYKAKA